MDIETKHASLDTLSVTIQALHVNGKQMTLAVFRQLPTAWNEIITNPAAQFWGLVRYRIPDEENSLWVVLSFQGTLYKAHGAYVEYVRGLGHDLPQLFIAV